MSEERETPAPAPRKPLMTAEKTAELARLRRDFEAAEARGDADGMLSAAEGLSKLESDEHRDICATKLQGLQSHEVFAHVMHLAAHFTRLLTIHVARRKALERRIAALEARPVGMRYRGIFDGGIGDYAAADVCTHKGQLWYCLSATRERPGESSAWKLMAKGDAR